MSKAFELARKLKELAERGVDGEKRNAAELLEAHCRKHGIDMSELESDKKTWRKFKVLSKHRELFFQLHGNVCHTNEIAYRKLEKGIEVQLTEAEYAELEAKFDFYSKEYDKQVKTFYAAFIHKNNLGILVSRNENGERKPMSNEEREELFRIMQMMNGMEKAKFYQQLKS